MTKLSQSGKRSFTVVKAMHVDGCETKVPNNSRLISSQPVGAAKKAFTDLCNKKKIKGVCTLYVTVQETTLGSNKKLYTYKIMRTKLEKPIELAGRTIEYENKPYSVKSTPHCAKSHKSSGPIRKHTLRSK